MMKSPRASYFQQGQIFQTQTGRLFKIERLLGAGSYGQVYLVSDAKGCYALKKQTTVTESELSILERLRSAGLNLVRTIEIFQRSGATYILMERCQRSLYDRVRENGTVTNDEFRYMFSQIAKGLKELHEMQIIHSDIKPENLLEFLMQEGQHRQVTYKICDFGISSTLQSTGQNNVGTPYYMAPEQFQEKYNQKVDIFALGCVMYEVVSGKILFNGSSPSEIEKAIKSIDPVHIINKLTLSEKYKQLIIKMVDKDPIKRYSIDQVLQELKPEIKRSPPKIFEATLQQATLQQQQYQQQQIKIDSNGKQTNYLSKPKIRLVNNHQNIPTSANILKQTEDCINRKSIPNNQQKEQQQLLQSTPRKNIVSNNTQINNGQISQQHIQNQPSTSTKIRLLIKSQHSKSVHDQIVGNIRDKSQESQQQNLLPTFQQLSNSSNDGQSLVNIQQNKAVKDLVKADVRQQNKGFARIYKKS